jgi:hypothetical protein
LIKVAKIPRHIAEHTAARSLLDRDVIFLCTDDHWGRSIVNQLVYQYYIPAINMGMHIAASNGSITGASGCVDILRPDLPCLWCRQFLRADRIAAESMPLKDRAALIKEGYVQDIDTPAPSVISINTTLSGMAVTAFLQLMTDFMGENGNISRLNYQIMEGTVRRGITDIADPCICRKVRGYGDLKSLFTVDHVGHCS